MFIKCEKCGAVFDIDASLATPNRSFQCSECGQIFKYTPPHIDTPAIEPVAEQPQNDTVSLPDESISPIFEQQPVSEPIQNESEQSDTVPPVSLPEEFKPVTEQPKTSKLFWLIIGLVGLIGAAMATVLWLPDSLKQSFLLEKEIQHPSIDLPALEVVDTSFRIVPDAQNNSRLLIQGALYNPATQIQPTQPFWVELYDAYNTLIYTHEIIPLQPKIMAQSSLPFYTEITPVPDNVKRMNIIFK